MSATLTSSLAPTLIVALGGAVGAALRFQVGELLARFGPAGSPFPWATLSVNILGSLAMGLLMGWIARSGVSSGGGNDMLRLGLGVGLLGGFTTFSAFSAEMVTMVHRSQYVMALGYGSASIIAGMAALLIGLIAIQSAQ